jgi:hypothetical protein
MNNAFAICSPIFRQTVIRHTPAAHAIKEKFDGSAAGVCRKIISVKEITVCRHAPAWQAEWSCEWQAWQPGRRRLLFGYIGRAELLRN